MLLRGFLLNSVLLNQAKGVLCRNLEHRPSSRAAHNWGKLPDAATREPASQTATILQPTAVLQG